MTMHSTAQAGRERAHHGGKFNPAFKTFRACTLRHIACWLGTSPARIGISEDICTNHEDPLSNH